MAKVTFARAQDSFPSVLRREVDTYFTSKGIKQTGNWKLYSKTIILLSSAVLIYIGLVFLTLPVWVNIVLCMLMGVNLSAIGFNVMHDGCHGSYSTKQWLNNTMGYTLDLMGGCSYFWKVKHNVAHHTYTNIEGQDDDIDIRPFIRLTTTQKKRWFHRYQAYYWPIFYSMTYIWWVAFRDFKKYFEGRVAQTEIPKMSLKEHAIFWGGKLFYIATFVIIPLQYFSLGSYLIGFGVTLAVAGITLALVFQMAHAIEDLDFPMPDPQSNKIDNEWFVHQLKTTANFATKSKFWGWLTGGLNFQVEHHLFPRISHIHYPEISKIVKRVCAEFNLTYNEQPTFRSALWSHLLLLNSLGKAA